MSPRRKSVPHFDSTDIRNVLIKGPSTAYWLYSDNPDSRTYVDIDVLVSPNTFGDAERVLETLGYHAAEGRMRQSEALRMLESGWERDGSPPTKVDLHRGFHGVADWTRWWEVMSSHTVPLDVAGRSLAIPDAAGCALVVALHDTALGRTDKTRADLLRALTTFEDDVWAEAAQRAEAVGALPSLVLGLSPHAPGKRLVDRLHLTTEVPPDVAIRSLLTRGADPRQVERAWGLVHQWDGAAGRRQRARLAFDIVFPSAEWLRSWQPMARRGCLGLTAVRVTRFFELMARTPHILVLVLRGRRSARRSGWRPKSP